MIKKVPAQDRHFTDSGWLQSWWLFSFSDYFDPGNMQFGALRVFNDDIIAPQGGFPKHRHREMEIITVVLDGEITHADSLGNRTVIKAGDVQRMSAGTGIAHSEFNLAEKPVHLYQIWMMPGLAHLTPSYDQKHYTPRQWRNRLLAVASGQGLPDTVSFHTDATVYRSELAAGHDLDFSGTGERYIFIYLNYGRLTVNGREIAAGDQLRIAGAGPLHMAALEDTGFILIDAPEQRAA